MKKKFRILTLGLFVAAVFSSVLWAEQRPENRRRRQGEVRGAFVGLAEREAGEREYLAIVIKPRESDDHVTVLVPRNEDFLHAARTLQKGDKVEIGYVVEEGQRWLKRIEVERVRRIETERRRKDVEERRDVRRPRREEVVVEEERERPRRDAERGKADELQGVFRRLWARLDRMERELKQLIAVRMERMERELKELRAENARLRRQLQERRVSLKREPAREVRERREREEQEKVRREREKARREREEVREQREEARNREEARERREGRDREESER